MSASAATTSMRAPGAAAAGPHQALRTRRMIASADAGYYKVGLLTQGSCRLAQQGREALLRPGDLAIARRWGFAGAPHFSKIFKAAYGVPPAQYRCAAGAPGSRPAAATSRTARWPAPTARAGRPVS
jgi:hypothetical protein